jgi:hypothetical protein
MWYDEIKDCGPFPGCKDGKRGVTGHFTAMIWDGIKELGCYANPHGIRACQYKGGDSLGCSSANMVNNYKKNVFKAVHSMDHCKREVEQCKQGAGGGGGGGGNPRRRDPAPEPRRRSQQSQKKKKNDKGGKKKKDKGGKKKKDKGGKKKKNKGGKDRRRGRGRSLLSVLLGIGESDAFERDANLTQVDRCYAEWLSSAVAVRLKEFVESEF